MASRFLRRSKPKPSSDQNAKSDNRPIARATPKESKSLPAGTRGRGTEKLPLSVIRTGSQKVLPQIPRPVPSTTKSVQPEASKGEEKSDLASQRALTENISPPASARDNRLRRKQSSADNRSLYARSKSQSSSRERPEVPAKDTTVSLPDETGNVKYDTILGISMPTISQSAAQLPSISWTPTDFATSNSRMANFMSTQLPHKLSTHDLAPPTPGFAAKSSSASTRCSTTSPSPFSRASTPTSTSSHSPAIHISATRAKQTPSPARLFPSVTRRRGTEVESRGLSALEESSIPSTAPVAVSETSVVNTQERKTPSNTTFSKLSASAPIPPLRSSSKRLPRPRAEPTLSTIPLPSNPSTKMPLQHGRQTNDHAKVGSRQQASLAHAFENPRQPPPLPSEEQPPDLVVKAQSHQTDRTSFVSERNTISPASTINETKSRTEPTATQTRPLALRSASTSSSSRIPTRSPLINSNGVPAVKPPFRAATPSNSLPIKPDGPKILAKSTSREQVVSPTKSASRLSSFSRRVRQGSNGADSAELPVKKGPAAGTGHEGYGKYARRGRTSSIGTASSRGRSTDDESSSEFSYPAQSTRKSSFASQSSSDLDDFYKERLEPVIIRGGSRNGEIVNNGLGVFGFERGEASTRADSNGESVAAMEPSQRTPMKLGLPVSPRDTDVAKRFPQRTSILQGGVKRLLGGESPRPSLAARRSFNRLQNSKDLKPLQVLQPINVSAAQVSPSLGSFKTILSAAPRPDSLTFSDDVLEAPATGSWFKARKLLDRAMPNKNSFFRRAQSNPKMLGDHQSGMEAHELFAAVSEVPDYRAVAHYCMLDDPDQEIKETLEDLLHEIENDLELPRSRGAGDRKYEQYPPRQSSVLLSSSPLLSKDASSVSAIAHDEISLKAEERPLAASASLPRLEPSVFPQEESGPIASTAKAPRLTQIGRIPKIVSKKDHMHKPPPRSFSRPFLREEYPSAANHNALAEKAIIKSPGVKSVEFEAEPVFMEPKFIAEPSLRFSPENDFAFATPRKRSGLASSTSSSGILDLPAITAIRPDSTASLDEDEIWNEYDELFDRAVFPYTSMAGLSLTTDPDFLFKPKALAPNFGAVQDASVPRYSRISDPISPKSTSRAYHISGALSEFPPPSAQANSTPTAVEPTESKPIARFESTSSRKSHHSHLSKTNSQSSRSSRRSTRPRTLSQVLEWKSRQSDTIIYHTLRYHAVMISQYLSFSRILFSPMHTEASTHVSERVLVLDGLGNDDWSLYCALMYPEAVIYNLGTSRPLSLRRRDSTASTSLPNHRQIQHVGLAHPFPFPKGFFAAVVWRFPIAGSEAAYYNAISEAKRVLRPGGYLELTVLDMDPVNMGNRARRAVRGLKVSMQNLKPDISLAPAGDSLQKMLGRKGFENLNRCVVGIPVVGGFGGSEPLQGLEPTTSVGRTSQTQASDMRASSKDFSSSLDDVSMLEAVGSVGRWWWGRCFEQWDAKTHATEEQGEVKAPSIWDEPALLRECEERETSFKLLLCYAQKPAVARRRTVSV